MNDHAFKWYTFYTRLHGASPAHPKVYGPGGPVDPQVVLVDLRDRLGWTNGQVGTWMGCSKRTVEGWAAGRPMPAWAIMALRGLQAMADRKEYREVFDD